MKKLSKLIFSCAAVAAVTAAVGTAAMAASYVEPEEGAEVTAVKIDTYTDTGDQETILIVKEGVTDVQSEDILYIDQRGETYTEVPVNVLEPGNYEVRIGGDGVDKPVIQKFTVGGGGEGDTVVIGNVNLDENNTVNGADGVLILQHAGKKITLEGKALAAAKVNEGDTVNGADTVCVLRYAAKLKTGTGNAGQEVPYVAE